MTDSRLNAALAAIDAANADDPRTIVVRGARRPKELAHAELMTEWLGRLRPDADELAHIAARGHHVMRWSIPRSDYPDGRRGYLRWRAELNKLHAGVVGEIMDSCGYSEAEIARVREIVAKKNLSADPDVQAHEDALCLVFIETQFADLADRLDRPHMVDVVRKTLKKMSPDAIALVAELPVSDRDSMIIADAAAE